MDHWTMDVQYPHLSNSVWILWIVGTDAPQDVVFRPGEESTSMWGVLQMVGV